MFIKKVNILDKPETVFHFQENQESKNQKETKVQVHCSGLVSPIVSIDGWQLIV
jgi:hypothetical protein